MRPHILLTNQMLARIPVRKTSAVSKKKEWNCTVYVNGVHTHNVVDGVVVPVEEEAEDA